MGVYIGRMTSVPSSVQPLAAGCFSWKGLPSERSPNLSKIFVWPRELQSSLEFWYDGNILITIPSFGLPHKNQEG
jgi:hypothetical protein